MDIPLFASVPKEFNLALIVKGEFNLEEEAIFPLPSEERRAKMAFKSGRRGLMSPSVGRAGD